MIVACSRALPPFCPNLGGVGLLHPAREDAQASGRFEAISPRRWDLRFRSVQRYDALVAGRLPEFDRGGPRFRAALASCQLLITLDERSVRAAGAPPLIELEVSAGAIVFIAESSPIRCCAWMTTRLASARSWTT